MRFSIGFAIAVLMVAASLTAPEAEAQSRGRYLPPAGPVLPNALNYFRNDVGVLDPYNAFVQPNRQLSQQINSMVQQQYRDYQRSEQEIGQVRQSLAAPTGVGAGFMNHAQYFNIGQQRPGRQAPRTVASGLRR
jgi:hypothetical protein